MKPLLVVAAGAVLLAAASAAAQTNATGANSQCGALTPPPPTVDGTNIEFDAMERATAAFRRWEDATRAVLECRRGEAEAARVRYEALGQEYNAGAEQLRISNERWAAEVEAFNARGGRRR
jgi:hypothetical protein